MTPASSMPWKSKIFAYEFFARRQLVCRKAGSAFETRLNQYEKATELAVKRSKGAV
jgi:hypothetical protein